MAEKIQGNNILKDKRFQGIEPAEKRILLSSPTMHGEEQYWVGEAFRTNWVTTLGANITAVEDELKAFIGRKEAVALSSGTAALHLAIRLAGEKLYGPHKANEGTLMGRKVFCSDMTFDATVNPVAYEGGEAVYIDTETDSWNMDPDSLEKAFELYPDVKLIVVAHLYGTPGRVEEIRRIADRHGAMIVEDAAESLGAAYVMSSDSPFDISQRSGDRKDGGSVLRQTGCFGDISVISFNGNKIITGSSGGMILTDAADDARRIRKWSTQARDNAPWYQHSELGYNYRMSNIVAGVVRGQIPHIEEHLEKKKRVYERYKEGLSDLPVSMNPVPDNVRPNYWLSCVMVDKEAMCRQERTDLEAEYSSEPGKSCPTEILTALNAFNAEGRPIWKPMHMQPIYSDHTFVSAGDIDNSRDIFDRALCLPSDNKMTDAEQDKVIEIIHRCFL
jgi:dTDP-4-amino-4,6-dideoxygalactose transaminase